MSGDALMDALRRHEGVWEGTYRHLDPDGRRDGERMRTWHWFRRGVPVRRTLCDERRLR